MNQEVFIKNRKNILGLMKDNSIFVLFNKPLAESNKRKNVDKNFYYVTGNSELNNIVILSKVKGISSETIFIKQYDELVAKWEGGFLSKEKVQDQTGIKNIVYIDRFESFFSMLLNQVKEVYLSFPRNNITNVLSYSENFANELKSKYPYISLLNANDILRQVRMVKSKEEITTMKKAIAITKEGIENMLKNTKVGMLEYQVESYFDQTIKYNNATHAFTTIAASGKNACCLHYSDNNSPLNDGGLMLLDLGSSYENYSSDISRTFPVNGLFSKRQKELYNIVLNGQLECIKFIKPNVTLRDINNHLLDYYEVQLKKIGLINNRSEISKYYYHQVSHHLGLDTHDLSDYDKPLTEGMIITCEPGLYIEEERIGIRIEDDILITKDANINLSKDIIKTVEEIEDFMKNRI